MRDPFFVVTSGRSGSLSLALTLNQHPLLCVMHEPYQELVELAYTRAAADGRNTWQGWFVQRVPAPVGPQQVGIVDAKLVPFIEDLVEAFPGSRFVWLVRDGRDVVASGMARGWYSAQEEQAPGSVWSRFRLRGNEVVNGQGRPEVDGQVWAGMTAFARNCWFWAWTQRRIGGALAGVPSGRLALVRLEQLGVPVLGGLQEWLGVTPLEMELLHANAGQRNKLAALRWPEWDDAQRVAFEEWAGAEMDELYPAWRETWKQS